MFKWNNVSLKHCFRRKWSWQGWEIHARKVALKEKLLCLVTFSVFGFPLRSPQVYHDLSETTKVRWASKKQTRRAGGYRKKSVLLVKGLGDLGKWRTEQPGRLRKGPDLPLVHLLGLRVPLIWFERAAGRFCHLPPVELYDVHTISHLKKKSQSHLQIWKDRIRRTLHLAWLVRWHWGDMDCCQTVAPMVAWAVSYRLGFDPDFDPLPKPIWAGVLKG